MKLTHMEKIARLAFRYVAKADSHYRDYQYYSDPGVGSDYNPTLAKHYLDLACLADKQYFRVKQMYALD